MTEDAQPPEPDSSVGRSSLFRPRFLWLLGMQLVFGLGFSSFLLLPKYLATVHSANADLIGRVMAAGPIASVLSLPWIAARLDRWPRHWLMFGSSLFMLFGSVGFAWTDTLEPWGYVWRAIHGVAFTTYMSTTSVLTIDLSPRDRLTQAVGAVGAANLATNALGPAVAEPLAISHGWDAVFLLSAFASLVAAMGALPFRERSRRAPPPRPQGEALFHPRFLRLIYAGIIVGVSFGTVLTFYQPLALQLGITELSHWFVGYTTSALGVRLLGGVWLDRFDRKKLSLAASGLYAAAVLATAALQPGWLFTLGLVLGLAHGALWPVLTALCVEGSNRGTRSALLTYLGGSFHFGVVVSTLGFGALAHALGYRAVIGLAGLFSVTSCAVLYQLGRAEPGEPESVRPSPRPA